MFRTPFLQKNAFKLGVLLIITCGVVWLLSSKATTQGTKTSVPQRTYLPIKAKQVRSDDGTLPVSLRCDDAELSAPNEIEKVSCVIVNNTNKRISAAGVVFTVIVEQDGETSPDSSLLTIETFIHPDLREDKQNNLIPPGGEGSVRPLPVSYDDAVIRGVSMEVDYVEFEDKSTFGPDKVGSRVITNIRAGAAMYKNWLVGKYRQNGQSVESLVRILDRQPMPEEEIGIKNDDQRQGAIIYRNHTRSTYESKGPGSLVKHLRQSDPSPNQ